MTVQTAHGELNYYRNWEHEGAIEMENPKTIKHYHELRDSHPDGDKCGVFFAFSNQQFSEGYNKLIQLGHIKQRDKVLRCSVSGMFGTKEGMDKFFNHYEDVRKRIKDECDPQEVYFYEYNNHECMISWDGDLEAIRLIIDTWGKDVAATIKRYNANSSIEDIAKED